MDLIAEQERIYACSPDGTVIAEITFPTEGGVANINHTYVDASLRGQGAAGRLVRAAADKIIADGNRIKATCSYAAAWFAKHPEYEIITEDSPPSCSLTNRH